MPQEATDTTSQASATQGQNPSLSAQEQAMALRFQGLDHSISKRIANMLIARDAMHLADQQAVLALNREQVRQSLNVLGGLDIKETKSDDEMIHVGDITINNQTPDQAAQQAAQSAAQPASQPAPATTAPTTAPTGTSQVALPAAAVAAAPTPLSKAALAAVLLGGMVLTQGANALWNYFQPAPQITVSPQAPQVTVQNPATDPLQYMMEIAK